MHFNKEVISILFYIPSNFFRNKTLADLGSAHSRQTKKQPSDNQPFTKVSFDFFISSPMKKPMTAKYE